MEVKESKVKESKPKETKGKEINTETSVFQEEGNLSKRLQQS